MARKNKMALVRKFLEEARDVAKKEQDTAARTERFRDAETYKLFNEILGTAIKLCGD